MIGLVIQSVISIHAPLAGSDQDEYKPEYFVDISIHAPLAGSDRDGGNVHRNVFKFQSTLPLRGATLTLLYVSRFMIYFNPRSPCGERPQKWTNNLRNQDTNPSLFLYSTYKRQRIDAFVIKCLRQIRRNY
ncbi:hypothetical protein HMPREF0620_0506 [Parascardovia denticolens DSM 10105 = JCM 12538]|uniref:Uncharacterized protein n=1 Tax=Parascardovia denticolens DSM 10105 = JCM 12538 TaxID=864564 RepID=E6K120_PARDN|nr:hypothetical protein HMPREF0620_0506 [Parascardovia denticolens DSM 10105 = JCM 12538]